MKIMNIVDSLKIKLSIKEEYAILKLQKTFLTNLLNDDPFFKTTFFDTLR